jgi:hypothetical protein
MVQLSLDCPYCHTRHAGFQGTQVLPFKPGDVTNYIMLMQCQVCGNGVVAKFSTPFVTHMTNWIQGRGDRSEVRLDEVFPKNEGPVAPEHIPDNVRRFYLQGVESLGPGHFDAAGTMFRKSLDSALRHLNPQGRGTLQARIDNLPANIAVTPSMKEWAHQIRHLGNDAAHEEEPFTQAEAETLQSFTELFFTYTFTLPGMIAARKPTQPSTV